MHYRVHAERTRGRVCAVSYTNLSSTNAVDWLHSVVIYFFSIFQQIPTDSASQHCLPGNHSWCKSRQCSFHIKCKHSPDTEAAVIMRMEVACFWCSIIVFVSSAHLMTHQLQQQLWMGTQRAADCSFCDSCILPQKHVIVVIWQHNCTETAKVEFTKLGDMDNESKGSTSCYLSGKRSLALAENALSKHPASREWSHNKKTVFSMNSFQWRKPFQGRAGYLRTKLETK